MKTIGIFAAIAFLIMPAWADDERPVITLGLSQTTPVVDGTISDNEYTQAVKLSGAFINHFPWMNKLPKSVFPHQPTVFIQRDDTYLYIAFVNPLAEGELPGAGVRSRDNPATSTDDAVEVYIQPPTPPGQLMKFYHIIGNARGALYDAECIPGIGQEIIGWNGNIDYAAAIHQGNWVVEMKAPLKSLDLDNAGEFMIELARNGGSTPVSYCSAFKQTDKYMAVRMAADAPFVKIESFGDFEKNVFNPQVVILEIKEPGEVLVEVTLEDDTKAEVYNFSQTIKTIKNTPVVVKPEKHALNKGDAGVARIAVYSGKNKNRLIFNRVYPYSAGIELPPPKTVENPLSLSVGYNPHTGMFRLGVDVFYLGFPEEELTAVFTVPFYKGDPAPLTVDAFSQGRGNTEFELETLLPDGEYEVHCSVFRAGEKVAENTRSFIKKRQEWENNQIGVSTNVPVPWTPLSIKENSIFCWGREYKMGKGALPAQIVSLNPESTRGDPKRDLLAEPVKFNAVAGGEEITFKESGLVVEKAADTEINVSSSITGGGLNISLTGTMEYDGFYKLGVVVAPEKEPMRVDSLALEIPLKNELARLLHSVGENMRANNTSIALPADKKGVLWDSKTSARNASVPGNFLPYFWMGDEDRGIAWMADNAKSLFLDHDKSFMEVIRTKTKTSLFVYLVNSPTLLEEPFEFVFSLQATPVKKLPPRSLWPKYPAAIGKWHFDEPMISEEFFTKEGEVADNYRYKGSIVTNTVLDENGFEKGIGRYFCFMTDRIPATDYYRSISDSFNYRWEWRGYVKTRRDFYLWCIKKWVDKIGLKSIYFDNTFPVASGGDYNMFGMREYNKRVYTLLKENTPNRPVLEHHMTDAACVSYLGFSDVWLDGEILGFPDDKIEDPDFVDRWGDDKALARIRAVGIGRQYGVVPRFLCLPAADRKKRHEEMHAILDIHDILGWGLKPLEKHPDVEGFPFYADDVTFYPYWGIEKMVQPISQGRIFASGWRRDNEALVIASNLGNADASVDLVFDMKIPGLKGAIKAVDEMTGEELPFVKDRIKNIKIERHKPCKIWLYVE